MHLGNLHSIKELGYKSKEALEKNNLELFGQLMHEHWEIKKKRSNNVMTNSKINECYDLAIKNGAIGGKVVGAGGGWFLMFMAHETIILRSAMATFGFEELRFQFHF